MLASSWSKAIRKSEKIGLVDRIQHCDRRPLYQFIFQGGDCDWALSSVRLRNIVSPARHRPIRPAMDPIVQAFEISLEVCLVVLPRQSVHSRCRIFLKFVERQPEQLDADMVQERGELFLPPLPCGLSYASQRL